MGRKKTANGHTKGKPEAEYLTHQHHANNSNNKQQQQKETKTKGESSDNGTNGCNTPLGCSLGTPIQVRCNVNEIPQDTVMVKCSNETCPAVPFLHERCFERWEEYLIQLLHNNHFGRSRNWTLLQCKTSVWLKKGYELIRKDCICPACSKQLHKGSCLRKCDSEEVAERTGIKSTRKTENPKKKTDTGAKHQASAKPTLAESNVKKNVHKNLPAVSASRNSRAYVSQTRVEAGGGVSVIKSVPVGMAGWREKPDSNTRQCNTSGPNPEPRKVRMGAAAEWPGLPRCPPAPPLSLSPKQYGANEEKGAEWTNVVLARERNPSTTVRLCPSAEEKTRFLRSVEYLVNAYGGSIDSKEASIQELASTVSPALALEIANRGSLEKWLQQMAECNLKVVNHQIFVAGSSEGVDEIRRGMGTVTEVEGDGRRGLIHSHKHDCFLLFTPHTLLLNAPQHSLHTKDIVSFEAAREEGGGSWVAQKVTLFQRDPLETGNTSTDNEEVHVPSTTSNRSSPSFQEEVFPLSISGDREEKSSFYTVSSGFPSRNSLANPSIPRQPQGLFLPTTTTPFQDKDLDDPTSAPSSVPVTYGPSKIPEIGNERTDVKSVDSEIQTATVAPRDRGDAPSNAPGKTGFPKLSKTVSETKGSPTPTAESQVNQLEMRRKRLADLLAQRKKASQVKYQQHYATICNLPNE